MLYTLPGSHWKMSVGQPRLSTPASSNVLAVSDTSGFVVIMMSDAQFRHTGALVVGEEHGPSLVVVVVTPPIVVATVHGEPVGPTVVDVGVV